MDETTHILSVYRATASEVLELLTKLQPTLFNCIWPMHSPYGEALTHNVYCNVTGNNLAAMRATLAQAAGQMTPVLECELMPNRI